jgi:hypothetical protein
MGLLGAFLSLLGCSGKSSYDPWAGDRKTLNPPPAPPNCPQLPELANLKLQDGRIVDVRIIQVETIKLYVPHTWLPDLDFNYKYLRARPSPGSILGVYDPDLHDVECPGIVHKFVSRRKFFDLGFSFVVRGPNGKSSILPNFSLDTKIDNLSIRRLRGFDDPKYATPHMNEDAIVDWPTRDSTSAYINLAPRGFVGIYPWPKRKPVGSAEWIKARTDVVALFDWLRTPPNRRHNDRIFKLGA